MHAIRFVAVLLALTICAVVALAVPEPPARSADPPPAKEIPDIAGMLGESNFGTVTQDGRTLRFDGAPGWSALGTIRNDGSILLIWTEHATGLPCPGVYWIENGKLVGEWGPGHEVTIEPDGSLSGETRPERLYRLPAADPSPVPDF